MPGYNAYANYLNPYSAPYGAYNVPYQPIVPTPTNSQNGAQQQRQIQDGGFIHVGSIEEAQGWPVAPGNSVTFKIDNSPYLCTKTMGFSQLEQPIFEKFRLVKEEGGDSPATAAKGQEGAENAPQYALKSDLEEVRVEIDRIKERIEGANSKSKEDVSA